MSKYNKKVAPYYDDYDSSKNYTQLLAIPGRVAQAREITQIQSVLKDIVKSIGDSILRDGNIIEGCQVIVGADKRSVTVTSGKVYINGMVLPVEETTLEISGEGTETVGVQLIETLITENEDNSLRDPAQGYDNYNQPGCHRIRSTTRVVLNDSDSAILSTLIDGAVSVEKYAPEYDTLTQTLARRTHDESGSYIVNGLNVRIEANANDSKFNAVIESGKAYVLGYELKIPAARRLELPKSMEYGSVTASNLWYDTGVQEYQLASAPYVRDITSVRGLVSKTVNQTISSNTDRVLLDELDVSKIDSVTQGGKKYTVGTSTTGDCYLQREGTRYYLKWNGTENYPSLNTSYTVAYSYTYTFKAEEDYTLYHGTDDGHYIKWLGAKTPLDGTNFTVIYNQYLARKDTIYIDQYGQINAVLGEPAEYGFEVLPSAPVNTLPLAYIMSPPGGTISNNVNTMVTVSNIGLTRFTMNDIQSLLNRVKTIEYDQAILSLNDEAKQYETSSNKRGIFTDPLIDLSKIDFYYNLAEGVKLDEGKPIYDAMIDLDSHMCYLPVNSQTMDAQFNTESTAKMYSRTATLAKSGESIPLSQTNATKSFLINPYSVYPQLPEISITPAVDVWLEDTIVTVPVSRNTSEVVSSSTRNVTVNRYSWRWGTETSTSYQDTSIGKKIDTTTDSTVLSEEPITYIRTRDIEVEGSNYPTNLDNIKAYFDGIEVPLTPTGSTTAGTNSGSIRSDGSGRFTAKFTIPDKVLTGIREVRLESPIQREGYLSTAFALYQASGTARTIQNTVTTVTTVLLNRVTTITTTNYIDPVGQTFVLDRMTMVSGIDLYFESKPAGTVPVTCEIREVVNGTITSTVYGHKTLTANQVNVSSDGRTATRFTFEDPVLLEENKEYAFVVRSTSSKYSIWVATLGENDIISGEMVLSNPYLIGVMMSSSNNSSWTTHQTTDIKFRLIADTYSKSAEILFDKMTPTDQFSRIYLLAESVIPNGTTVNWSYSLDSGSTYRSISPYNIEILDQLGKDIIVKANISRGDNTNLSPIIALDSVGAVLSSYDTEGYYITKTITGLDPYTNVDIVLDTYIPSNTAIKAYVSTDNGTTLTEASLDSSSIRALNYGWRELTYKATVTSATQCKLFIKLTSDYKYFTPAFRRLRVIMS